MGGAVSRLHAVIARTINKKSAPAGHDRQKRSIIPGMILAAMQLLSFFRPFGPEGETGSLLRQWYGRLTVFLLLRDRIISSVS
jgi:hypothetical protein